MPAQDSGVVAAGSANAHIVKTGRKGEQIDVRWTIKDETQSTVLERTGDQAVLASLTQVLFLKNEFKIEEFADNEYLLTIKQDKLIEIPAGKIADYDCTITGESSLTYKARFTFIVES